MLSDDDGHERPTVSPNVPKGVADSFNQLAERFDANLDSVIQKRADAGYGLEVVPLYNYYFDSDK